MVMSVSSRAAGGCAKGEPSMPIGGCGCRATARRRRHPPLIAFPDQHSSTSAARDQAFVGIGAGERPVGCYALSGGVVQLPGWRVLAIAAADRGLVRRVRVAGRQLRAYGA